MDKVFLCLMLGLLGLLGVAAVASWCFFGKRQTRRAAGFEAEALARRVRVLRGMLSEGEGVGVEPLARIDAGEMVPPEPKLIEIPALCAVASGVAGSRRNEAQAAWMVRLFREGKSVAEIAGVTGQPVGRVELVIRLHDRRKGGPGMVEADGEGPRS